MSKKFNDVCTKKFNNVCTKKIQEVAAKSAKVAQVVYVKKLPDDKPLDCENNKEKESDTRRF
jgi:hypothetical protein